MMALVPATVGMTDLVLLLLLHLSFIPLVAFLLLTQRLRRPILSFSISKASTDGVGWELGFSHFQTHGGGCGIRGHSRGERKRAFVPFQSFSVLHHPIDSCCHNL